MDQKSKINSLVFLSPTVIVCSLGYFVDLFDILLFSLVRKTSLAEIGIPVSDSISKGELLLSIQMLGLFIGGLIFGIIGDRRGRLAVLFASIVIYSAANVLNSFITTFEQYSILRFVSGVGLAGELGAGITLVSEIMPKEKKRVFGCIHWSPGIFGSNFCIRSYRVFPLADLLLYWRMHGISLAFWSCKSAREYDV